MFRLIRVILNEYILLYSSSSTEFANKRPLKSAGKNKHFACTFEESFRVYNELLKQYISFAKI